MVQSSVSVTFPASFTNLKTCVPLHSHATADVSPGRGRNRIEPMDEHQSPRKEGNHREPRNNMKQLIIK